MIRKLFKKFFFKKNTENNNLKQSIETVLDNDLKGTEGISKHERLMLLNILKIDEDIVVSIFLTSNKEIQKLNNQYRNKNKPTNVLSFPMQSSSDGIHLLGDIVLSNQTLLEESIEQKVTKYDHLCKMTIHGMLHLLGHDHNTEKQFKRMNKFENIIFDNIKQLS